MSWIHDAPVGQAVRGESESGRPFVALKISAGTAAHNPGLWNTSEGPATDYVIASGRNLVRLKPDYSLDADRVVRPLTPEDFYTRYDEHHIFSFFEVEDGGRFYTFGHVNFSDWGEEIHRYLAESDTDHWPYEGIDETAMSHVWVVGSAYPYAPEEIAIQEVSEGTPGASRATVYAP